MKENMEIEYTKEQTRAAKRAAKALNELSDSGLHLIWHAASHEIYAVPHEIKDCIENSNTNDYLSCGFIDDAGDW